jgi:hypothetical protein
VPVYIFIFIFIFIFLFLLFFFVRDLNSGINQINAGDKQNLILIMTSASVRSEVSLLNEPVVIGSYDILIKSRLFFEDEGKIVCSTSYSFPSVILGLLFTIFTSEGYILQFYILLFY